MFMKFYHQYRGVFLHTQKFWNVDLLKMALHTISLSVAQWKESPPGVWEAMGSIPVGDLDIFFVPRSWHDN